MSRALVAVFKSQVMAEADRRKLTDVEAARALRDLCLLYASKVGASLADLLKSEESHE
jgi:hypothetical protein